MALAEKKRVRKTRSYTARQAKVNDTKITKLFKPERKTARGLVHSSKKIDRSSVLRTEDGLVDLSKTPHHLVATVERNAASSPLLRLPSELRNKICALAVGSHYIDLKEVTHSKTKFSAWVRTSGYAQASLKDKTPQPTAFHLPEVCRQIYCETATLAYKLNTFIVDFDIDGNRSIFLNLLPAQRNAITAATPHSIFFEAYVSCGDEEPLRKTLPNLKRVEVSNDAVSLIMAFGRNDNATRSFTEQNWQASVAEKVKMREGDDIEVVFELKEE